MPTIYGIKNDGVDAQDSAERRNKVRVYRKQFSQTYLVIADTINDTEVQILATSGLPTLWSMLRGAYCTNRSAKEKTRIRRHPSTTVVTTLWEVTCKFDSNVDPDEANENRSPESQVPSVGWSGENIDEVITKELNGLPIVNTAGQKLLVTRPTAIPVLTIQRIEVFPFEPTTMLNYANKVNSSEFYGAPPGSALMLPMTVDQTLIDNAKYNDVTYRIKFKLEEFEGTLREDTWQPSILNEGQLVRSAAGEEAAMATDKNQRVKTVNLDVDGLKLDEGEDPLFIRFEIFESIDFNALSLGPFT